MKKPKRHAEPLKKALDRVGEKGRRGRPPNIQRSWVLGRAGNYRFILDQVWDRLWPLLSQAQNEAEVAQALRQAAPPYERELIPLSAFVLPILNERRFPKRRSAQIGFLADSLGGAGSITPRRSRDICLGGRAEEQKAKAAREHHIVRYEFYIECSCSYKGRSLNHACAKCGAVINFGSISSLSPFLAGTDSGWGN